MLQEKVERLWTFLFDYPSKGLARQDTKKLAYFGNVEFSRNFCSTVRKKQMLCPRPETEHVYNTLDLLVM